jgi:hypothetical protein
MTGTIDFLLKFAADFDSRYHAASQSAAGLCGIYPERRTRGFALALIELSACDRILMEGRKMGR